MASVVIPYQQQPQLQVHSGADSLKHCECRNAKELIQLIRSDGIEVVEMSWPDDMGLWYSSTIRSHEVSLQNLVEGIRFYDQILMVDSSSARYDFSKKQKTVLVRCSSISRPIKQSNNNNSNYDAVVSESPLPSPLLSVGASDNSSSPFNHNHEEDYYDEDGAGDGEVYRSPQMPIQSKLSYLVDETERQSRSKRYQEEDLSSLSSSSPPTHHHSYLESPPPPTNKATKNQHQHHHVPLDPSSSPRPSSFSGKRKDAEWLECPKNRVELMPDLSNPMFQALERSVSPTEVSSPGSVPNTELSIDSTERLIIEGQIQLPPLLRPRQYHACKIPKEERPSKRRKNHTTLFCRHCGTNDTPEWRRGPDGRKSLCNACGLHYSKTVKREQTSVAQKRRFDINELLNPVS
eukprot:gene3423-3888_t